jgi:hypothetical protein
MGLAGVRRKFRKMQGYGNDSKQDEGIRLLLKKCRAMFEM